MRAAVSSQTTLPALLWAPSLPGQQKGEPCAFQLSAVLCRNISADIFTGKVLSNLQDILCQTLACPKRLPFFNKLEIWPKRKGEEERVNSNIEKGISLEQKPSIQIPKQ